MSSDEFGDEVEHDDDHLYLDVELSESDLKHLAHGSGVTFEFRDEDKGKTVAVGIGSERDIDRDWLMSSFDDEDESQKGLFSRLFGWLA